MMPLTGGWCIPAKRAATPYDPGTRSACFPHRRVWLCEEAGADRVAVRWSRVSLLRYLPHSTTTTAAAEAVPVKATQPQTKRRVVEKHWHTSPMDLSDSPRRFSSLGWCAHGCGTEVHKEAKAGHRCVGLSTAAQNSRPAREVFLSALLSSTEGENNRRLVMVAVVLAHGADLPVGVKTYPWHLRTDRSPELPEDPHLLLLTEH